MSEGSVSFWWHLVFTALGAGLIVVAFVYFLWARARTVGALRSWVSTPGVVLWSNLEEAEQASGSDGYVGFTTLYFPRIEYSFQAGGERRGTTPFLMYKHFVTPQQGQDWLRTVPPNKPVTVWYDPADPSRSALVADPMPYGSIAMVALVGVGLIGTGWFFVPHL